MNKIDWPFMFDAPGMEKLDEDSWIPDFANFPKPVLVGDLGEEGERR